MSVASSSTIRALRSSATPIRSASRFASTHSENSSSEAPYIPRQPRPYSRDYDDESQIPERPARPESSLFFTGKPVLNGAIESIRKMLVTTQERLRTENIYPLPPSLPLPSTPHINWKDRYAMQDLLQGEVVKHGHHRRITQLLNELHRATYLAQLGGNHELAAKGSEFLAKYATTEIKLEQAVKKEGQLDSLGRALASGKRKTASAQVWIIPAKSALDYLDVEPKTVDSLAATQSETADKEVTSTMPEVPAAQILINHSLLPKYFRRPQDRHAILRPFKLTGLLGAYNVFALVKGGGETGQAEAVALGLAKALAIMRPDTRDVLFADGALMRNPKTVERKKTNMLKARKARRWVKR